MSTWTTQNKVLPGVYINFEGNGSVQTKSGERGVCAMALPNLWLESDKFMELTDFTQLPIAPGDTTPLAIMEAFKKSNRVYVYRVGGGTAAKCTVSGLTATAVCTGQAGNNITIAVSGTVAPYTVTTFVGGTVADAQKVETIGELVSNGYVKFSGTGALTATAGTALAGGTSVAPSAANYKTFLDGCESIAVNAIACLSNDTAVRDVFVSFAKRIRGTKYLQVVVPAGVTVVGDFEGVIAVANGVFLDNGKHVDAVTACAYVAAATAACPLTQSLTSDIYLGAVEPDTMYTIAQQEEMATTGRMVFVPAIRGGAMIQKDINSLVSLTPERPYSFSKNKIIRILDDIGLFISRTGTETFLGKVQNNQTGRDLFKATIATYFSQLFEKGILQGAGEISITAGTALDSVVVKYAISPADTMDVIYNTVVVG